MRCLLASTAALGLVLVACAGGSSSNEDGGPVVVAQGGSTGGSAGATSQGGTTAAGASGAAGKSQGGASGTSGASGFPAKGGSGGNAGATAGTAGATSGGGAGATNGGSGGATSGGGAGAAGGPTSCTTRITYGDAWIHPSNHPDDFDQVDGPVTWDGACTDTGSNSKATLSNGWQPIFSGNGNCVIAIDTTCPGAPPSCTTRITYGSAWLPPANHPNQWDDVGARVFWDRACIDQGGGSYANLSNGWQPHFGGSGACRLSFEYEQCGGLYANPVIDGSCPDPGVLLDGDHYVMACTTGDAGGAYPLYTSPDLVHFTPAGHIFPAGSQPAWADGNFWAPEIHKVGGGYVAYFAAHQAGGRMVIGAATSSSATSGWVDIGAPIVADSTIGVIDPTEFEDENGTPYLVWKTDGNGLSPPKPTILRGAPLSPDGTSVVGSAVDMLTNDPASWEGIIVEAPWVVRHGGTYFLFYSGNWYNQPAYAIGVATSAQPLGQYARLPQNPILSSDSGWDGPGHCSVLDTPAGDTYVVYHAWKHGEAGQPGAFRRPLVDALFWDGSGNPYVPAAPSVRSRPMP